MYAARCRSLVEDGAKSRRVLKAVASRTIALGETHEIRIVEGHPEILVSVCFLFHRDHAESAVVEHDDDQIETESHCRLDFLAVHSEATIAGDHNNLTLWIYELGGNCRGQTDAHRAQRVVDKHRIGLACVEVARRPQHVDPVVERQDVFIPHEIAQTGNQMALFGRERSIC